MLTLLLMLQELQAVKHNMIGEDVDGAVSEFPGASGGGSALASVW